MSNYLFQRETTGGNKSAVGSGSDWPSPGERSASVRFRRTFLANPTRAVQSRQYHAEDAIDSAPGSPWAAG